MKHLYGLDIETDTSRGGLDPRSAGVIAVAVCGKSDSGADETVIVAPDPRSEPALLGELDNLVAGLEPGILVTWNGAGFDLPFLHLRGALCGIELGLRIYDRSGAAIQPGEGRYAHAATWHGHGHLDALRAYRRIENGTGRSCSLKETAARAGLDPVHEDASAVHQLDEARLRRYVASDARIARTLAIMQWDLAQEFVDKPLAPQR